MNELPPEVQAVLEEISAYQIFIWLALAIGLGVWIRKAWPTIKRAVKTLEALETLPEDMKTVKHELFPNSGNSLRDRVDQTREQVEQIGNNLKKTDTKVTTAIAWQKKHQKDYETMVDKVDQIASREEEK